MDKGLAIPVLILCALAIVVGSHLVNGGNLIFGMILMFTFGLIGFLTLHSWLFSGGSSKK
jgi:hypothetical protein